MHIVHETPFRFTLILRANIKVLQTKNFVKGGVGNLAERESESSEDKLSI